MTPLATFTYWFPLSTHREEDGELIYSLHHVGCADLFGDVADEIIKRYSLPLVAEVWTFNKRQQAELVVRMVPDPTLFDWADEVPEEEPSWKEEVE